MLHQKIKSLVRSAAIKLPAGRPEFSGSILVWSWHYVSSRVNVERSNCFGSVFNRYYFTIKLNVEGNAESH